MSQNVLQKICADKRTLIAERRAKVSLHTLEEQARHATPVRGFLQALQNKVGAARTALIAEIKKASPSKGVIRPEFEPPALALAYEKGGATCLSVLTDTPYFQGRDGDLALARGAVTLPVLRKDFMLDPYQMPEARMIGADAVLLIMAALSDAQAVELEDAARAWQMDVLVEVHDEAEMERALTYLQSPLIGINNRNLKTLEVDLATTERLAALAPEHTTLVCESGIFTSGDIAEIRALGVHCFLVGESLMRERDVESATRHLLAP